ncbi:hypothetical protein QR680_011936 [Steinernema hermaphroditum]|uniref:Uncharacterized protein n=1 Tax=Steinernema hermaphroditum TaxID=289476 RepID=A0AA39LZL7_9BILA|nr:hypothetical protein QR680_011936 [Steinernema hermaphroditum]
MNLVKMERFFCRRNAPVTEASERSCLVLNDLDEQGVKAFDNVPKFFQEWKIDCVRGLVQPLTKLLLDHLQSQKLYYVSISKSDVDDRMFEALADLFCNRRDAAITVEEHENAIAKPASHVVRRTVTSPYVKKIKSNIKFVKKGKSDYLYEEAKKD